MSRSSGANRPGPLAGADGWDAWVPAGDLGESWPPLGSPLLPSPHSSPAHPCSPRAPAWNPGLAPASAPTLGSAQPSRGATCVVAEAAAEPLADSFPPPLALGLSHPLLASSIHLSQETPAPSPALCPCTSNSDDDNTNRRTHSTTCVPDPAPVKEAVHSYTDCTRWTWDSNPDKADLDSHLDRLKVGPGSRKCSS